MGLGLSTRFRYTMATFYGANLQPKDELRMRRLCDELPRRWPVGLLISVLALALLGAAGRLAAQSAPVADEGPAYRVSQITIGYEKADPRLPDLASLGSLVVTLGLSDTGYTAVRNDQPTQSLEITLIGLGDLKHIHGSGLQAISAAIVAWMNQHGFIGIYVRPDPAQIDDAGQDLRPAVDQSLRLVVYTATIAKQRTLASGDRVPHDRGINNTAHSLIVDDSPLKVGDPIDKRALDDYIYFLNRHPGRRVDVALGAADEPGQAVVDYMVTENKPWLVYAQVSNTGTDSTGTWRERFGFIHNQLTSHDDTLSLDFNTAGFGETFALSADYEIPFFFDPRWSWRIAGGLSRFDSEEIGQGNVDFQGEQWWVDTTVRWNFYQHRQLFIDAFAGVRYQDIEVDNNTVEVNGSDEFFLPHGGLQLQRQTDALSTTAYVDMMVNVPGLAGTGSELELERLGRLDVEREFAILSWQATQSLYLEPLLWPKAWADPSTPASSTLAHELYFSFRGQHTFDTRVVPQLQGVAGGFYSVRGYDESAAAGDTTMIFTAEYRFHLPRIFGIDEDPYDTMLFGQPFRVAPQEVYGRPDWDLIFRGFVDVGKTQVANTVFPEEDSDLLGVGVGIELQFRRNLTIRADWGYALEDAGPTREGDSRLHFVGTLLY